MFRIILIVCVSVLSLVTGGVQARTHSLPDEMTLHKIALTWDEAQSECQRKGAVLASPISYKALKAMKSWIDVKNTMYFTGLRSWHTGTFASVEGVPLENITVSAMDMIVAVDQTKGDCLAMNSDSIRAVPCWTMLPYMCYDTRAYNMDKANCGPDEEGYKYEQSERQCYKAHSEVASWVQAEQTCIAEGGHLVVIDNDNEARLIKDIIESHPGWSWVTTGLYYHTSKRDWRSVHGQQLKDIYNVWHSSVNPSVPGSLCAIFGSEMVYGINTCENMFNFICERAPTV